MYNVSVIVHSLLRWIILILLVVNILRHFSAINKPFTSLDKKLGLWLMISAHITLLLGLYQYFSGDYGYNFIQSLGFAAVMKNDAARFWAVEHILGMVIAIVFITIGKGISKKNISDKAKHTRTAWLFLIALIIIIACIPWPGRDGVGRPLLPSVH